MIIPVITSGSDGVGVHKIGGAHFQGRGLDARGNTLRRIEAVCIEALLKDRLPKLRPGVEYVVIWEVLPNEPARNHFHLHAKERRKPEVIASRAR